ncbi:unnamed protein product, partial [Scytosiphon promiscuus]
MPVAPLRRRSTTWRRTPAAVKAGAGWGRQRPVRPAFLGDTTTSSTATRRWSVAKEASFRCRRRRWGRTVAAAAAVVGRLWCHRISSESSSESSSSTVAVPPCRRHRTSSPPSPLSA